MRHVSYLPLALMLTFVASDSDGQDPVVAFVREVKDSKDPAKSYTTTWFDMWRLKDGKADEHWDPATRMGQ